MHGSRLNKDRPPRSAQGQPGWEIRLPAAVHVLRPPHGHEARKAAPRGDPAIWFRGAL